MHTSGRAFAEEFRYCLSLDVEPALKGTTANRGSRVLGLWTAAGERLLGGGI